MAKIYKYGFYILLLIVIAGAVFCAKMCPTKIEGIHSWLEFYSSDQAKTVSFFENVFEVKVTSTDLKEGVEYKIFTPKKGFFPYAGVMQIDEEMAKQGLTPQTTSYITTKCYKSTDKKMLANGATRVWGPMIVEEMKMAGYSIPGDLYIAIVEYNYKESE
ncbi:MAG: hypothetical protein HOF07_01750 [Elusimicrobiaceae bacterium]|jgi:predicted enzyme related to lactoylglutathione lyase|nr:hypothetical protein [Elusimicrobiaceae bacterium]